MVGKHWTEAIKAENEELKRQVQELRLSPNLTRFASEVGNNIMIVLANKPYDQWPELAKMAFKCASDRQEVLAHLYQERLPKGK